MIRQGLALFRRRTADTIVLSTGVAAIAFLTLVWPLSGSYAQQPFYSGKTINVVIGTSPGGSQDVRTKIVMRFLQKHIPGNPHMLPQYMPGGGGMKSANYLYSQATRDGLMLGSPGSTIVDNAILGLSGVRYDLGKFVYLGVPTTRQTTLFMTRKQLGLTSLDRLRNYDGLRIPGQAVGHAVYIWTRLFAWLLDLKQPRFVLGYSTPERDLAFQQGEADVTVRTADVIEATFPDYLKKGLVDFHAALDFPIGAKHPVFGFLPQLDRFAKTEKEQKLLELTRAARIGGTPFVLPPGTPREAVEILQQAIARAFKDPEFQKEFRLMSGEEATPLLPEDHEQAIKGMPREGEIVELYKRVAGVDPLPAR